MIVKIFDHQGNLIGRTTLDTAIEIHEIENGHSLISDLYRIGSGIGRCLGGYVRLEKES